jgi:Ca2+-dependent lipid-binding protein
MGIILSKTGYNSLVEKMESGNPDKKRDKTLIKGSIHLKLQYIRLSSQHGMLNVEVVEAKELASRNRNGLCDSYVIINLEGTEKKTRKIKKTLNPIYNQQFDFVVKDPLQNKARMIILPFNSHFFFAIFPVFGGDRLGMECHWASRLFGTSERGTCNLRTE